MTQNLGLGKMIDVSLEEPIWERFFQIAPLVVVGTRDEHGNIDLAPKHMAMPLSWQNYFGFVCSPTHTTLKNLTKSGSFAVSYPRPDQVLLTSLAAAPRCGHEGEKVSLQAVRTVPAKLVTGDFVADSDVMLECEVDRLVEGIGPNTLIVGKIVAAHVHTEALRAQDLDDQDLIDRRPLMAYLHPGRIATVKETQSYPFPKGFKR
jgi:flavin reductase (DIM6/NTAB) family NADH-FMN oxidoreductase RutF